MTPGDKNASHSFQFYHFCYFYWQDCRAAANCRYYIYSQAKKIRFFAPQGRLIALIQVKLGRADRHQSLLGRAKFHLNRSPQNIKNFHFLVKISCNGCLCSTCGYCEMSLFLYSTSI